MGWWHYLLLVNIYLVLFFGFYTLLLSRETFFQLNRVYLVVAALLSFFIPLIQSDWVKNLFITKEVQSTIYSNIIISSPVITYNFTPAKSTLTIGNLFNVLYIAVTLFFVLRLLWQLVILKKAIEKPTPSAAYSFFKKISLGDKLKQADVISAHEQVHASQWHSADVLIIEAVMIINWFNPVVYLYRFAIKYIHEFIADKQVILSGTDKADYALLLLSQTFDMPANGLVTPFYNHSLLKKRIVMLQKNRSQRIALARYALSAPLFILMLVLSSATVNNSKAVKVIDKKADRVFSTAADDVITSFANSGEIPGMPANKPVIKSIVLNHINKHDVKTIVLNNKKEGMFLDTIPGNNRIYTAVEVSPEFPGGMTAFYNYLGKNLRYPAIDRENKIEGKVYVNFVIEKDGSLSDIKALRGPSKTLMEEAVRVMAESPKWRPGIQNYKPVRVVYTVPVNFTLNGQPRPPAEKHVTTAISGDNRVFTAVEHSPEFPGGIPAFYDYLRKNVRYPAIDRENKIEGKVYVNFVIEKDGSLTDIKALRGPSETLMQEGVRVMAESPKWKPGTQNDMPVRVAYTVPINFNLTNGQTPVREPVNK